MLYEKLSALEFVESHFAEMGSAPGKNEAMKKFEEGIKLTRQCQAALKEAEQKVEILLKSAGGEDLEGFEVDDD